MDTNELIKTLASHSKGTVTPLSTVWLRAVGISIAIAALVFFALLGLRPDISTALETPRFLFKFLVTVALAVSAFFCVRALSRPGENRRNAILGLAIAPALIAMAVGAELFVLPSDAWTATMIGQNSVACLTYVTTIGLGPLAVFLWTLRYGAPVNPAWAGSAAGLLAGGIAASFYAAHCTDDSPLFVATWYTIAVAILAALGAAAAGRLARW
jgi:hypothetical protein